MKSIINQVDEKQETKSKKNAESKTKKALNNTSTFTDNRPEAILQRRLQDIAKDSQQVNQVDRLQKISDTYYAREKEADIIGQSVIRTNAHSSLQLKASSKSSVIQRVSQADFDKWYQVNKEALAMFGDKPKVIKAAEVGIRKGISEITVSELNDYFGVGEEEEYSGPVYNPSLSAPTDYERVHPEILPQKFGEMKIKMVVGRQPTYGDITITYNPVPDLLPAGTTIGFLQVVRSPKIQRDAIERQDPDSGFTVDRQGEGRHKSPYYGVTNDGYSGPTDQIDLGTESKPAIMKDTPMWSKLGESVTMHFETAAIVMQSPQTDLKGGVLASINWILTIDPYVSVNMESQEQDTNLPSKEFINAVMLWNSTRYKDEPGGGARELVDLGVVQSL